MTTLFLSACAILLAVVFCLLREIYWLKLSATLFDESLDHEREYRTSGIARVKRTVERYADVMEWRCRVRKKQALFCLAGAGPRTGRSTSILPFCAGR